MMSNPKWIFHSSGYMLFDMRNGNPKKKIVTILRQLSHTFIVFLLSILFLFNKKR